MSARYVGALLAVMLVGVGCGGNGNGKGAETTPPERATVSFGTKTVVLTQPVGPSGGTLLGPAGTPIEGVTVRIPAGAVEQERKVSIGHDSGTVKPVRGTFGGTILTISAEGNDQFYEPVEVSMRYPGEGTFPVAYHVDRSGRLHLAEGTSLDPKARTFTFLTFRASSFAIIHEDISGLDAGSFLQPPASRSPGLRAVGGSGQSLELGPYWAAISGSYDSGFRPDKDGFEHDNQTGKCTGFTSFSQWYFKHHKGRGDLIGRFTQDVDPDGSTTGQDVIVTRAWTSIHLASWRRAWVVLNFIPTDYGTYWIVQNAIANTAAPVVMRVEGDEAAHSVLAYACKAGRVSVYDPNSPFVEQSMQLSRPIETPFGVYGWGFAYQDYYSFSHVGDGSAFLHEPFTHILEDAEANFRGTHQAKVTITSHTNGQRIHAASIALRGKISSGDVLVDKIDVEVNGLARVTVDVPVSGDFSALVPLVAGDNEIVIVPKGLEVGSGRVNVPTDQLGRFLLRNEAPPWNWCYLSLKAAAVYTRDYPPGESSGSFWDWWEGPVTFVNGAFSGTWTTSQVGTDGFAGSMTITMDPESLAVAGFRAAKSIVYAECPPNGNAASIEGAPGRTIPLHSGTGQIDGAQACEHVSRLAFKWGCPGFTDTLKSFSCTNDSRLLIRCYEKMAP